MSDLRDVAIEMIRRTTLFITCTFCFSIGSGTMEGDLRLVSSNMLIARPQIPPSPKKDPIKWPTDLGSNLQTGLQRQIKILNRPLIGKKIYDRRDLLFVAKCVLRNNQKCRDGNYVKHVRAVRLNYPAGKNNDILYTGYFTPEIEARREKSDEFRYPILKRPKEWRLDNGPHATREEIDIHGVLEGRGLEIAWTKQPLAIFQMQLQGSGVARFADGSEKLLTYDGDNGHPHLSLGKLLLEDGYLTGRSVSIDAIEAIFERTPELIEKYLYQNPSYVFFKSKGEVPLGAAGVQLTAGHSIAVDPNVIPFGAVLIGKVPVLGSSNKVQDYAWRLLFAQDSGGAITGADHVDLFAGTGDVAKGIATSLHHYGELWLLLPRH